MTQWMAERQLQSGRIWWTEMSTSDGRPKMGIQLQGGEESGTLDIVDGIHSDQKAREIRAGLGDLAGVYGIEISGAKVRVHFVPALVTEQQFYQAIKTAGFQASGFAVDAQKDGPGAALLKSHSPERPGEP
jgi:copper chaperone CopZ